LFGQLSPPKPPCGDGTEQTTFVTDPFITDPFIIYNLHDRSVMNVVKCGHSS